MRWRLKEAWSFLKYFFTVFSLSVPELRRNSKDILNFYIFHHVPLRWGIPSHLSLSFFVSLNRRLESKCHASFNFNGIWWEWGFVPGVLEQLIFNLQLLHFLRRLRWCPCYQMSKDSFPRVCLDSDECYQNDGLGLISIPLAVFVVLVCQFSDLKADWKLWMEQN